MRWSVLTTAVPYSGSCLRACYAMSGTDLPYCATTATSDARATGKRSRSGSQIRYYFPMRCLYQHGTWYDLPMRCPRLAAHVVPSPYAMSGTSISHGANTGLGTCYTMFGTDLAYGPTRLRLPVGNGVVPCLWRYAFAMRCPVLTYRMLLPGEWGADWP
eukprot:306644-Rhodomonas_salina.1